MKPVVVNFKELCEAFELASFGSLDDIQAFLCKRTGKIYLRSAYEDPIEEVPDDIDDPDKFIEIPHKNDLDLGKRLALRFAYEHLPKESPAVEQIFRHKGAYWKFKNLLERCGLLEQWYEYEAVAQEKALREWCEQNSIHVG